MADNLSISPSDRDFAIRTMMGEEGAPDGMAGVASTILNRAQSGKYGGSSLKDVVLSPGQFEPWSARPADLLSISADDPRYKQAANIFDGVASGKIPDMTNGATHFYAPAAQKALGRNAPAWASGPSTSLGQTSFYSPAGAAHYTPPASVAIATATNAKVAPPSDPASDPVVSKYMKPAADPAQDPLFSKYLKPIPSAAAPAASAPPPTDPANDPLFSKYLKPDTTAPTVAKGAFPPDDPRNNPLPSFTQGDDTPNTPPSPTTVDPHDPISTQIKTAARLAGGYVAGQVAATPGAILDNFDQSAALANQGKDELAAGNVLPSFPSADPHTWSAGGAIKAGVGSIGAIMSPISGVVQTGVQEPVTQATGSPGAGEAAGFVANSLAGPAVARVLKAAPGAIANKLVGGLSPEDAQLADLARSKYGIPLNATQMSDSNAVRFAGSTAARMPFSGAGAANGEISNAFTRAVSHTFGEDADKITPNVMKAAKTRLGNEFDTIAANTTTKVDAPFVSDIHGALNDAKSVLPDAEVKPLVNQVQKIYDTIDPQTGTISGDSYQALTRKGTPLDNLLNSANPNTRFYAGQIRDALDGAMQRSATPDMANRLSVARGQYKAMKTIEDLVEKSPTGTISPAALMTPVRSSYGNMAYSGGGDLGNLARIGQRFLKEPPSSGTAERLANMNMFQKAGAAGAALTGLHVLAPDAVSAGNAAILAGSIPTSIAAGRAVGGALRSKWLANNMLSRSLGTVPANPISAGDLIPALAGGVSAPGFQNKFLNP